MRDNPVVPAVPGESEERVRRAAARCVACPYCEAPIGSPCHPGGSSRRAHYTHAARKRAALARLASL